MIPKFSARWNYIEKKKQINKDLNEKLWRVESSNVGTLFNIV